MKKAICLLFAVLMVLSLTGCNPTQTITCVELTMKVPQDMKDVNQSEEIKEYGFTFAMENETLFICGLRQDLVDIENGKSMTLEEYTMQLFQLYGLDGRATYGKREGKDYVYLRFNLLLENGLNEYLCGVYKSPGAFWLIQMNSLQEKFDEAQFYTYLDSVTFRNI